MELIMLLRAILEKLAAIETLLAASVPVSPDKDGEQRRSSAVRQYCIETASGAYEVIQGKEEA